MPDTPNNTSATPVLNFPSFMGCKMARDFVDSDVDVVISGIPFDIDCLDPSFAPGTGTPVVGGLSSALALKIIRGLVGCKLVGMDIVEVCPPYDHAEITSLAAATLGLEFLYVLAANRKEN